MDSNLRVRTFRNGDQIIQATSASEWKTLGNKAQPAWCHYGFDPSNEADHGLLYNWYAINDPRLLAPSGTKLPELNDWLELITAHGGADLAAFQLKNQKYWPLMQNGNTGEALDYKASKIANILPSGQINYDGSFANMGKYALFWTSTEHSSRYGWYIMFSELSSRVFNFASSKRNGFSVRCIIES